MKISLKVFVFIFCLLTSGQAWCLEVYFKNGDKITGTVIHENDASLVVRTLVAGDVRIDKAFIDFPKTFPERYAPPKIAPIPAAPLVVWKKDFALGYTQMGGNTKSQAGQLSMALNRKTAANETTFKYTADYSSANGIMNGKKFYGLARYAYSFGNDLKWYNFYKIEGDEDYFADIAYRLTPASGIGYWFSNTPDWKASAELGAGYQYTAYRVETSSNGGVAVLTPRFFFDRRLIGNLHLSEDFTFYPSLADIHDYRFLSETDLVNQFSKEWDIKISLTDNFDSFPPPGFKKNDYTLATSLDYHF